MTVTCFSVAQVFSSGFFQGFFFTFDFPQFEENMPADMRTTFASARLVVARSWKPPKCPPAGAGHQRGTATRRGSAPRRGRAGVPLGGGATPGARAVGFHLRGAEDKRSWLVEAEAHGRAGPRLRGRRPGLPPRPSVPTRLPPGSRDRGHPEAVLTGVVLPAASGVWTRTVLQKFLGLDTGHCVLHPKAGRRYVRRDRVQTRGRRRSELSPCPSPALAAGLAGPLTAGEVRDWLRGFLTGCSRVSDAAPQTWPVPPQPASSTVIPGSVHPLYRPGNHGFG